MWVKYTKKFHIPKLDKNLERFIFCYHSHPFPLIFCLIVILYRTNFYTRELNLLQQQLQDNRGYQLYCLLVGGYKNDDNYEVRDWSAAHERKTQKINEYIDSITNLDSAIQELECIVKQIRLINKEKNAFGLNDLLRIFGQKRPDLASQLIEQVLNQNLELKYYLGFVLAGINFSNQRKARLYVRSWINSNDLILWQAIAISYRFINWSQPHLETEWKVLLHLVKYPNKYNIPLLPTPLSFGINWLLSKLFMRKFHGKQSAIVDQEIFELINRFAPYNSELAVELLKILAARKDENTLNHVAEAISCRDYNNEKRLWNVEFSNFQDLVEIINNFERLPYLNFSFPFV